MIFAAGGGDRAAAAVAVRDGAADFANTQLAVHLHYSPFELECPRI